MPTILRLDGCRYFFYSNEGSPREPPHVHVEQGDAETKVWIAAARVGLADSQGFSARELQGILFVVTRHKSAMEAAWHEHFG